MTPNQNTPRIREDIYRLLAACYYPPTPALSDENCCEVLASLLQDLSPEASEYAKQAATLAREESVESLAVEHARLFIGPFQLVAPPYGSFYLEEKTVMGDSTAAAEAFYADCGLHLAEDFHELPDHISVELEFVSFLAFRQHEAEAGSNSVEAQEFLRLQAEFLQKFLLPWVLPFTDAIIRDGESSFYQALARCTAAFVTSDAESVIAAHE